MRYPENVDLPFTSPVMREIQRRVTDPSFDSDGKLRLFGIYDPPGSFGNQRNSILFLAPQEPIIPIFTIRLNDFAFKLLGGIPELDGSGFGKTDTSGLSLPRYYFEETVGNLSTSILAFVHPSSLSADLASQEHASLMRQVLIEEATGGRSDGSFDFEEFLAHRGEDRRDLAFGKIAADWVQNLENSDPHPFKY